jgi:hypothetical protein
MDTHTLPKIVRIKISGATYRNEDTSKWSPNIVCTYE